jgi:ornithine carbamoyltransferase
MSKRDFLSLHDVSRDGLLRLLERARRLKTGEEGGRPLAGQTLAMLFWKSSTRTRVSFEVGMFQLGGHALYLTDQSAQFGRGESTEDTARVLSRMVDAVMIRTFSHQSVVEFAAHSDVPVINGLTDLLHPCQLLADLQTVAESFGDDFGRLQVTWVGDGNNMAHSWLNAAAILGFGLRLACPEGYDPDPEILARASDATEIVLTRDPREAAEGAHVVTTDVFTSMGQEAETEQRLRDFAGFQVDARVMERAREDAIFLHCLPAHRGEEVTAEVIDGPASRVFDEAENRLHAQKALLVELLGHTPA